MDEQMYVDEERGQGNSGALGFYVPDMLEWTPKLSSLGPQEATESHIQPNPALTPSSKPEGQGLQSSVLGLQW